MQSYAGQESRNLFVMQCNSYLLAVSAGLLTGVSAFSQTPPPRPANGPGGADYPHARVQQLGPYYPSGLSGDEKYRYFVFQPADPRPKDAPVVLLLHGRSAVSPEYYLFWIRHLVRKGYLVVWTQFEYFMAQSGDLLSNALTSYSDPLDRIQNDTTGTYVQPLRDQNGYLQTAILGHSFGAYLGVVMAAHSTESGSSVPVPKLLFGVNTQAT